MFFRTVFLSLFFVLSLNASLSSHGYDYMESMKNNSPEFVKIRVVDVNIQLETDKYKVKIVAEVLEVYKTFTSLHKNDVIFIDYEFDRGLLIAKPIPILEKNRIYSAYLIDSVTIYSYAPYAMSKSFN